MAWGEVKVEDQRKQFIEACLEGQLTIAELCRRYEISPKSGYKWLRRYESEGISGLQDRSRAPLRQALKTPDEITQEVLKIRYRFPTWGPKKVLGYLKLHHPDTPWPATTTIGNLFDKNGLTVPRKLRRRVPARTQPLSHCQSPNDVWCADFKGWFLTGDGNRYEPFTLTDGASRYLLRCVRLDRNNTEHVWAVLDAAFRENGLPLSFRTDNGAPFATCGPGRLSKLSINLIKANVVPEWIDPGKPQQNGRHERMHKTLKGETASPPEPTMEDQDMTSKKFQKYYNNIRPHEALGQKPPASMYQISSREWNGNLKSPEYDNEFLVRKVRPNGQVSMRTVDIYIGPALVGEPVGLKEIAGGYEVYYGTIFLGKIDEKKEFTMPQSSRRKRKCVK
jgi:putative transposase